MSSINEKLVPGGGDKGLAAESNYNHDSNAESTDTRSISLSEEITGSFDWNQFEEENSEKEIVKGVSVLEELQVRGVQHLNQTGGSPESIHLTIVFKNVLYTNYAFFEEMEKMKKIPEGLHPVFVMGDIKRNSANPEKVHVYFLDEADYKIWQANNLSLGVVQKELQPKKPKMVGI